MSERYTDPQREPGKIVRADFCTKDAREVLALLLSAQTEQIDTWKPELSVRVISEEEFKKL
jgi:hypothetical protein